MTSTPDSAGWITGKSVLTLFHPVWDLSDTVSAMSVSILKQRDTVTSDLSILALFILKPRPNSGPKPGEHSYRAFSWEIMFTRTRQTKNQEEKKAPSVDVEASKIQLGWGEKKKNKGNRRSRNREERQRRFVFYVTRLLLPTRHQEQNYVVASSELTWRL